MQKLRLDTNYLLDTLDTLLRIPSPTGFTDRAVFFVSEELEAMGVEYELTRRGAIRATLPGERAAPARAVVAHLDTLGAMVTRLKENGRLALTSIGHWSARFAEGARVTLFTDEAFYRGTILPLKASGHTFNEEVDTQPVGWDHVELRVDAECESVADLMRAGVNVGDFVAIDSVMELSPSGYINARHLDNKAGAAVLLAATRAVREAGCVLPIESHILFTISEEVGSGASAILHGDVAEMVTIDNGTVAPGQNSREKGATISMKDMAGPFDYHLTHRLIKLAQDWHVPHQRDVFRYYRSDSASALEAGNDIRVALVTFGLDASHGYERVHLDALRSVADLVGLYLQSPAVVERDRDRMTSIEGFPEDQVTSEPEPPAVDLDIASRTG